MRPVILKLIAAYFTGYPRAVGMDLLYTFFKDFGTICFVAVTSETAVIEFVER
jgi:hypothetical protein